MLCVLARHLARRHRHLPDGLHRARLRHRGHPDRPDGAHRSTLLLKVLLALLPLSSAARLVAGGERGTWQRRKVLSGERRVGLRGALRREGRASRPPPPWRSSARGSTHGRLPDPALPGDTGGLEGVRALRRAAPVPRRHLLASTRGILISLDHPHHPPRRPWWRGARSRPPRARRGSWSASGWSRATAASWPRPGHGGRPSSRRGTAAATLGAVPPGFTGATSSIPATSDMAPLIRFSAPDLPQVHEAFHAMGIYPAGKRTRPRSRLPCTAWPSP